MIKYRLSRRLKMLAKLADSSQKLADIGTDHGYLPLYLLEKGQVDHCILCDINQGPLDNAKRSFKEAHFSDHTDFRLGSGIEPLKHSEVDTVVIAGMGGGLIIDILSKDPIKSKSFDTILLQPMTEQNILRQWLMEQGFNIKSDHYVHEGSKFYEIIEISTLDSDSIVHVNKFSKDLEFGYKITKNNIDEYIKFLMFRRQKYEIIMNRLEKSISRDSKYDFCVKKINTIDSILVKLKEDAL